MRQTLIAVLLATAMLHAQPPQPPPPPDLASASGSVSGSISQFNYGPDGRVEGFLVAPNTLVLLPPDWGMQIEMLAKRGDSARVTGAVTPVASGMQIMDAQTVSVAGRTLSFIEPGQPAPYAGSGAIRQLNYGRRGEVNGFVLGNGIIARTPPFGASDVSVIKPGATIALSGFAHTTPAGKTVVDVQSISVNGQTIAMGDVPPAGPPRPGRRGPRPGPPPPPPPDR